MQDNELILFDRKEVIKNTINKYGIDNFYLSFSGGKDSTVLHYLLDEAIPNNNIPRLFINTGIEYNDILNFVKELQYKDKRIIIYNVNKNIKQILDKVGYPFKSKEHSLRVEQFNKGSNAKFIKKYTRLTDYQSKYVCPKKLLYQFEERGKYNFSNKCCNEFKKKPIHQWEKENNKHIAITGMRAEEGGNRERLGCIITNKKGQLLKFHPLIKVTEEWEDWFINAKDKKLCRLYYSPFYFKRTGCKGCPYSLDLQEQLEVMNKYLPNEYKQCEHIWEYTYKEYRRLGYRISDIKERLF